MAGQDKNEVVKLLDRVLNHAGVITRMLMLISIASYVLLPAFDREDFFDENAILAGSAAPTVQGSFDMLQDAVAMEEQIRNGPYDQSTIISTIQERLTELNIEHYSTAHAPRHSDNTSQATCQTLHAIIRSPRGDGKESILVVTPIGAQDTSRGQKKKQQTLGGAAVAASVGYASVAQLQKASWLARSIVWVIPDARCGALHSMEAWLGAYYFEGGPWRHGPFGRAGLIQQALVLDILDSRNSAAEISLEGYNGQLPKLDMYWLVKSTVDTFMGIGAGLRDDLEFRSVVEALAWDEESHSHLSKLATMSQFVWRQAVGVPTGAHAAFQKLGADAVTLRLFSLTVSLPGAEEPPMDINELVRVCQLVELTVRSCNNLLERLHHSYNLYLQTAADRFLTVDLYVVPLAALLLALLLQAGAAKASVDAQYELQAPHTPTHLATHVSSWLSSIRLVLMGQVLAAAAGTAVRASGTQKPQWLLDQLAQCRAEGGTWRWEGDCVTAVSTLVSGGLLMVIASGKIAGGLRGAFAARRQQGSSPAAAAAGGGVEMVKVKVVMISSLAVGMAAVACINWALAFLWLLPLSSLAILVAPSAAAQTPTHPPGTSSTSAPTKPASFRGMLQHVLALSFILLLSPPVVIGALYQLQGASGSVLVVLGDWLHNSSVVGYMVVWMFYLPVWGVSTAIALSKS